LNIDTWGRTKISTKRGAGIDRWSEKPATGMSALSEDKKNLSRAKEKARRFITENK